MELKSFKKIELILLIVFLFSCVLKFVINNYNFSPYTVADPDLYIENFKKFKNQNIIDTLSNGTSFLFNVFILLFHKIVNNDSLSVFLLNLLSQIFLLVYGFKMLKKYAKELNLKYKIIVFAFYLLSILELNSFNYTFNDTFQAVFFLLVFNIIFKAYFEKRKITNNEILWVSFLSALCTLIRPTSLIFIVVVSSIIFFYNLLFAFGSKVLVSNLTIYLITTIFITIIFHSLSLTKEGKLGFYDKNFNTEVNWTQRNFLALTLMNQGEIPISKNSIFREVKFERVKDFIDINGENSLPKNSKEFIEKDFVLYLKLISYNVFYSCMKFFRYYGFLFFMPFLYLFNFKKITAPNLFFPLVILSLVITLSASCFTLIEFRWFTGYSILIALMLIDFLSKNKINSFWSLVINLSIILVTIFNFYFTFSVKDY